MVQIRQWSTKIARCKDDAIVSRADFKLLFRQTLNFFIEWGTLYVSVTLFYSSLGTRNVAAFWYGYYQTNRFA